MSDAWECVCVCLFLYLFVCVRSASRLVVLEEEVVRLKRELALLKKEKGKVSVPVVGEKAGRVACE